MNAFRGQPTGPGAQETQAQDALVVLGVSSIDSIPLAYKPPTRLRDVEMTIESPVECTVSPHRYVHRVIS